MKEIFSHIFLDTYKGNEYTGDVLALHLHPYHEISLVKSGEITYVTNKSAKYVSGKSLIFSPAHQYHNPYIARARYDRIQLVFDTEFLYNFLPNYSDTLTRVVKNDIWPLTDAQYSVLEKDILDVRSALLMEKNPQTQLLQAITVAKFMTDAGIIVSEFEPAVNSGSDIYIDNIIEYINANYSKKITLAELSKNFFVSRSKLINDFKRLMGISLNDFIILNRIEFSKEFLASGLSVSETAEKCGFSTASHYINTFKKHMNMTPLAYSKKINIRKKL